MREEKNNLWVQLMDAGVDEILDNKPFYKQKPPSFAPTVSLKLKAQLAPKLSPILQDLSSITTLDDLEQALQAYEGCPFKNSAKNLVFGEGNPHAKLMVIGEAPGAEEDREGKPFVGPAGHLLDRMMTAIGLTRDDYYVTNVVYWRPPQNQQPTPEDVATCYSFLAQHIRLINPRVILSLGAVASKALTDEQMGITQMRGKFYPHQVEPNRLVLPTFHPANLLRTPLNKRYAWHDLLTLKTKLTELS